MLTPKQILRNETAKLRQSLSGDDLADRSQIICKRLVQTDLFQTAHCVALYYGTEFEVQTSALMEAWRAEKLIVLPVISGENMHFYPFTGTDNMRKGAFGIPEPVISCEPALPEPVSCEPVPPQPVSCKPVPPEVIDLFVVPGIAFDYEGNRLGRGKGYYDRYLSDVNKPIIGLCFDFQLIEHIPDEIHDKKMTFVITESLTVSSHHQSHPSRHDGSAYERFFYAWKPSHFGQPTRT